MVRFFIDASQLGEDTILLSGENAAHARVLRLKNGEQVLVCDGQGAEALCSVSAMDSQTVELAVLERQRSATEPAVKVSVYMALPKAEKLEHVIQKATELGVSEIVTFPTRRCVSRPDEKSLKKKLERWQKIAASASEQSGRGVIPQVVVLPDYRQAIERASEAQTAILLYENEHATTLRMALDASALRSVSLISGPEGGFEEEEVKLAEDKGIRICTLGRRILRCETAPLCALSAVMYAAGEF